MRIATIFLFNCMLWLACSGAWVFGAAASTEHTGRDGWRPRGGTYGRLNIPHFREFYMAERGNLLKNRTDMSVSCPGCCNPAVDPGCCDPYYDPDCCDPYYDPDCNPVTPGKCHTMKPQDKPIKKRVRYDAPDIPESFQLVMYENTFDHSQVFRNLQVQHPERTLAQQLIRDYDEHMGSYGDACIKDWSLRFIGLCGNCSCIVTIEVDIIRAMNIDTSYNLEWNAKENVFCMDYALCGDPNGVIDVSYDDVYDFILGPGDSLVANVTIDCDVLDKVTLRTFVVREFIQYMTEEQSCIARSPSDASLPSNSLIRRMQIGNEKLQ